MAAGQNICSARPLAAGEPALQSEIHLRRTEAVRSRKPSIARDSAAPRQASGDEPGSSVTSSAPSMCSAIELRHLEGVLGVEVVAARDDQGGSRHPLEREHAVEGPRAHHARIASATASGWTWRSSRWRIASPDQLPGSAPRPAAPRRPAGIPPRPRARGRRRARPSAPARARRSAAGPGARA